MLALLAGAIAWATLTLRGNTEGQSNLVEALVAEVVDGDTIKISLDGQVRTLRYIGIDTPETIHPTKGTECYGPDAKAKNKELVGDKTVRLEKDVSRTDRYGRLLRYVYAATSSSTLSW